MSTNEEDLSALIDGELPRSTSRFVLRRLDHDSAARDAWQRYHCYGDVMRGQRRVDLVGRVAEALADDDAVDAYQPRRFGALAGLAVAASVAVVTLGILRGSDETLEPIASPVAGVLETEAAAEVAPMAELPLASGARASVASGAGRVEAWNDPRLQAYVMRHNEASGRRGQGLVPYIYLVSTTDNRTGEAVLDENGDENQRDQGE